VVQAPTNRWKQREPHLGIYHLRKQPLGDTEDQQQSLHHGDNVDTGFYTPGTFVALTHDGGRVAHQADDGQRIKVFDITDSMDHG
jgi:hypothetical protein